MNTPWFVYIILVITIVIAGAVMVFASMDPEGRAGKVANISIGMGIVLVIVLAILVVLDLVRWISTS